MNEYTVTINGKTFTRKSKHQYKTAAAWVNTHTGEVKNVTFSKETASPSRFGVCEILTSKHRSFYPNAKAFMAAQEKSVKDAQNWRIELVNIK